MSRSVNSQDSYQYHTITSVCIDIFLAIITVEKKQSQWKKNFSSLLLYMEEKQIGFVESCDTDIKKLVANPVPESKK